MLVTTADGYAFRHALIREAVHEDLLPGEHSSVHTKFALAIDADPALVSGGRADIELAHHWYSAHNTTGALTSAWRASAQASRTVAHAERLMLLARVLEMWDQVPDAAEHIGADHVRVLEEAAAAAEDAGEQQRGLAFVESALSQLDVAAEPVRYALLLRRRYSFRHELGLDAGGLEDLNRALDLVPDSLSAAGADAAAARRRALRHATRRARSSGSGRRKRSRPRGSWETSTPKRRRSPTSR